MRNPRQVGRQRSEALSKLEVEEYYPEVEVWAGISSSDTPEMIITAAKSALMDFVDIGEGFDESDEAVLVAEAVNWAAKEFDERFYWIKPIVWNAAAQIPGVEAGWCPDGTFALRSQGVGTVHAHDPWGELWELASWAPRVNWQWSGIPRQHLSLLAMRSPDIRRLLQVVTGGEEPSMSLGRVEKVAQRLERQMSQNPPVSRAVVNKKWLTPYGKSQMDVWYRMYVNWMRGDHPELQHAAPAPAPPAHHQFEAWVLGGARVGDDAAQADFERRVQEVIDWIQETTGWEGIFERTPGQIFEELLFGHGLVPVSSGDKSTTWAGSWGRDIGEGYFLQTNVRGWSVIYREDRSRGITWGNHSRRIKDYKGKGWHMVQVQTLLTPLVVDGVKTIRCHVNPVNMNPIDDRFPGETYLSNWVRERTYPEALEYLTHTAAAVAEFMNDLLFHQLERQKMEIRRNTQRIHEAIGPRLQPLGGRPCMADDNDKVDSTSRRMAEEAYVTSVQLGLPNLAIGYKPMINEGTYSDPEYHRITYLAVQIGAYPPVDEGIEELFRPGEATQATQLVLDFIEDDPGELAFWTTVVAGFTQTSSMVRPYDTHEEAIRAMSEAMRGSSLPRLAELRRQIGWRMDDVQWHLIAQWLYELAERRRAEEDLDEGARFAQDRMAEELEEEDDEEDGGQWDLSAVPDDYDPGDCPGCGGDLGILGVLGNTIHLRCSHCGADTQEVLP